MIRYDYDRGSDIQKTKELMDPFFFMVDKNKDKIYLTQLCLRLKELLEPSSSYPAHPNRYANSNSTALHNAVISARKSMLYRQWAPPAICTHLLGQEDVDRLMADKRKRGFIPADSKGVKISFAELVVAYLCQQGANVNAMDQTGRTPIFFASRPEIIHLLRRYGSDLTIRRRNVVKRLRTRGEDNDVGWSVAYDHIKDRNFKAVEALLEYKPGQNNMDSDCFYQGPDGQYFYREGEYIVLLSDGGNRPTVCDIQRVSSPTKKNYRAFHKGRGDRGFFGGRAM